MAALGSGYDISVSTFSPDGRVFQVEYAGKAVDNSGTCIGLVCKDGVLLGVEKFVGTGNLAGSSASTTTAPSSGSAGTRSGMLVPGTNRRICPVDQHMGIAMAGMLPDARQILERAQDEVISFKKNYGEDVPAQVLAERLALYVHAYTLYWSVRPFGAAVLLAAIQPSPHPLEQHFLAEQEHFHEPGMITNSSRVKNNAGNSCNDTNIVACGGISAATCSSSDLHENFGTHSKHELMDGFRGELYCIEPSGTSYKYRAVAVGKGKQIAKTELEQLALDQMSCTDALFDVCRILYLVHDESKDKQMEIEAAWICKSSKYRYQPVPPSILEEANRRALAHHYDRQNS